MERYSLSDWKGRKRMKLLIASDIHGSSWYCEKLLNVYKEEGAQRMILLGDILYHGPRNDLPAEYAPKKVIEMLNAYKDEIHAVRGNCEAEVDQMVLQFPVLADYMLLFWKERAVYVTHGHIYNEGNRPPMRTGDVLLHGHTHVLRAEEKDGIILLNPGSVSIPKEGNPPTYAVYEDERFSIRDFEGNTVKEIIL